MICFASPGTPLHHAQDEKQLIPNSLGQEKLAKVRAFLEPTEKALWVGVPPRNAVFDKGDILQIPFSIFFTVFSIIWITSAFSAANDSEETGFSFFPLFGVPFVLVGLYMLVGRFIYRWWRNGRTIYAVTDRNVLALVGSRLTTTDIGGLREVQQSIKSDGSGSIIFGAPPPAYGWFRGNGLEWLGSHPDYPITFRNISNVRAVNNLVENQKKELNRR